MRSLCALLLGLSPVAAQYLINDLSFGYDGKISPNHNGKVPNFVLHGRPSDPEVLSNKIILTPPSPGGVRASVWAEKPLQHHQWVADVDFRASGPEHAGGNLNVWLVSEPKDIGLSSIHQVGKFEGLALVLYTYGNGHGMIRGFLNDGNKDYSKMSVDGQSFGNCDHAYRNLGRPSQLKFRQTAQNFKVEIDGQLCFETNKISIPAGYKLGITAASADNPDSFEVFKMVVMSEHIDPTQDVKHEKHLSTDGTGSAGSHDSGLFGGAPGEHESTDPAETFHDEITDHEATWYTSSSQQFADLHDRLTSTNHHLSTIFQRMNHNHISDNARHDEAMTEIRALKALLSKLDHIDALEKKIGELEHTMNKMNNDFYVRSSTDKEHIQAHVEKHHFALHDAVKHHTTTHHWRLIFIIVGSQLVLVAGYVMYKRKQSMPKKYL